MKTEVIKQIPANYSKESIKDVVTILILGDNKGLGMIDTTIIHLDGTVDEKLQQYKEATGKDWLGTPAQTISEVTYDEPAVCLDMGKALIENIRSKEDQEVQDKIDALAEDAREFLKQNEQAKKAWVTKKEVEALTA